MIRRLIAGSILLPFGLAVFALFPLAAFSATSGPNSPSSCTNDATVGTVAWTSPGNGVSSNNAYATATTNTSVTNYLKCVTFGFSIPAGSTINGITVEIERSRQSGVFAAHDSKVVIVKADGTFGTTDKADTATNWPTTDAYKTYGGSSDLWGESWTSTDINDADFGAAIAATRTGGGIGDPRIDHIRITVDYTESGGAPASQTRDVSYGMPVLMF